MFIDELRRRLKAHPFVPFIVHTAGGSEVEIHHHDHGWLLPSGWELHVEDRNGRVHLIQTSQITKLTFAAGDTVDAA